MSDESKAALQYMVDLAQQAEDAYSELNDYMTDIFGDLGNSMTDALVNAFVSGTDAARAFTESVSSMLETLSKQMIYSVTLAPVMEQAQSSADGNHREVKPVLDGGKTQMKHLGYRVHDAIGRGKHHAALDAEEHARAGDEHRQRKAEQPQWQRKR